MTKPVKMTATRPVAVVDRGAAARVRFDPARRPHAPRRGDRPDVAPDGRRLADEAFGDEVVWLDWQRPGFDISKRIADQLEAQPGARAVLHEKHARARPAGCPRLGRARRRRQLCRISSAPVVETTLADWERNHSILTRGYFLIAGETFRVLVEQGAGAIVFVASKNALVARKNTPAYSSAKAAELHLGLRRTCQPTTARARPSV
jgi:NAD(P)-dependent dehydrogenase (short-subunit alcohol dehydrogenase family)